MSRLIVKNLPAHITPEHLRKHFEQAGRPEGTLTDVKVAHKQDGTSRRFGFVGYKTDLEAASAKTWFDKTFLGSTRITVDTIEVCFLSAFHSVRLQLLNRDFRALKMHLHLVPTNADDWILPTMSVVLPGKKRKSPKMKNSKRS